VIADEEEEKKDDYFLKDQEIENPDEKRLRMTKQLLKELDQEANDPSLNQGTFIAGL